MVTKVYTDDYCVFVETSDGDALIHSPEASINNKGETWFGIKYISKEYFDELKKEYALDSDVGLIEISSFD